MFGVAQSGAFSESTHVSSQGVCNMSELVDRFICRMKVVLLELRATSFPRNNCNSFHSCSTSSECIFPSSHVLDNNPQYPHVNHKEQ
jgi:hypothetical protein